jgi:hypothetical protein
MKTILAVLAAVFLMGANGGPSCETKSDEDLAHDRCKRECPQYGAVFVRLSSTGSNYPDFECWCRRGAEAGGGSEPLRIW